MGLGNLRVVADTNLIVSAMLTDQTSPQRALDYVVQQGSFLLSSDTFEELTDVLLRPRFQRYLSIETRLNLLAKYERDADWITVNETITACRDPKDNKFLELAVSGQATHVITGDVDLLVLNPFQAVSIVSPRDFLSEHLPP